VTPRRFSDDSGSALVFALIFVGIWSIVVLAILSFAEAGFNLAAGSAEQRDEVYAADGAVDAALARLAWWDWAEDGNPPEDCGEYRYEIEKDDGQTITIDVVVTCAIVEDENPRIVDLTASIVGGQDRLVVRAEFDYETELVPPEPPAPICPDPPDPEDEECEEPEPDPPIEVENLPATVDVLHWRPLREVAP
jgi:hypothetical protein